MSLTLLADSNFYLPVECDYYAQFVVLTVVLQYWGKDPRP